ncbi:MAG TPA: methylated-DNA--[protein]-cysteine S-methyltransferase [Natronosporangium sp.]|nr:methylated-DNA--[protein]-cysteine S-methyltransferase [Natronosporangium sp.]
MNLSTTLSTPAGPFTVVVDDTGAVRAAGFTAEPAALLELLPPSWRSTPVPRRDLGDVSKAVEAYLAGDHTAVDSLVVAHRPGGGDAGFLARAWAALRRIPPGRTLTYTRLATAAGRPAAVRAAGMACARNPVSLIVPCHRVVRADGALGGYRWGVEVKRWLLNFEAGVPDRWR